MVSLEEVRPGGIAPGTAQEPDQAVGAGPGLERRRNGYTSIREGESVSGKRRAVLPVSFGVLAKALNLPEDTEILSIEGGGHDLVGMCGIVVGHPDFQFMKEGERIPILSKWTYLDLFEREVWDEE